MAVGPFFNSMQSFQKVDRSWINVITSMSTPLRAGLGGVYIEQGGRDKLSPVHLPSGCLRAINSRRSRESNGMRHAPSYSRVAILKMVVGSLSLHEALLSLSWQGWVGWGAGLPRRRLVVARPKCLCLPTSFCRMAECCCCSGSTQTYCSNQRASQSWISRGSPSWIGRLH